MDPPDGRGIGSSISGDNDSMFEYVCARTLSSASDCRGAFVAEHAGDERGASRLTVDARCRDLKRDVA